MVALPNIAIVFMTYKRTEYALRTIRAACKYLRYQQELVWYVADDGSPNESHLRSILDELSTTRCNLAGFHSRKLSYGGSANKAWTYLSAHGSTPLTFWLEDDWELNQELDLTPYAQVLIDHDEIGMIRMGYLSQYLSGVTLGYNGHLFWRLDREPTDGASPVFTGHPSLRHDRYRRAYGQYPEGLNPGDTELGYAHAFRVAQFGPHILWPAMAGQWGWFDHIGEEKSYS